MNLAGKLIGRGANRSVYEYTLDSSYVIKFEHSQIRANFDEINTYRIIKSFGLEKHFAPCWYTMSGNIIMQRGENLPSGRWKVPSLFFPTNSSNYKLINGSLVAVDYDWRIQFVNGTFFWTMPCWDYESISDILDIGNYVKNVDNSVLYPGEEYSPPLDRNLDTLKFVQIPFEKELVKEWFSRTRTLIVE